MSGVTGAPRVKTRADYDTFVSSYADVIGKFPGIVSFCSSGSYISNPKKQDFGDIDLVVHIEGENKSTLKKELVSFFDEIDDTIIVPFISEKHAGRKSYNSGEIVTVQYYDAELGYSAQIDNIIALNEVEASFKGSFLDMPAPVQGLVLGLVKAATVENCANAAFEMLGIDTNSHLMSNEEFEFNLSSIELQLRKVTYVPGTYKQVSKEVVWRSSNYNDVRTLLNEYDLDTDFDKLLAQVTRTIRNPRSAQRIIGIFGSMITVKSGEVGTAKGKEKIESLENIRKALG
jgi:hypothetical protein